MKKTLLFLFSLFTALSAMSQMNIPYQEIRYDAHFHVGFVNVRIGHVRVCIDQQGENFRSTLEGKTIPWEGRVYCVNDTLNARFYPGSPLSHEIVTYVNGCYTKPLAAVLKSGRFDFSDPDNFKNIRGQGRLDASNQTMEAVEITADMLSLYHYYREIDFDHMSPGEKITIPIAVEGGDEQSVTITYQGKSSVECGGVRHPTYSTVFEFTYHGYPSGYPVKAQVDTDSRIPVFLSANLEIGRVELFLI